MYVSVDRRSRNTYAVKLKGLYNVSLTLMTYQGMTSKKFPSCPEESVRNIEHDIDLGFQRS